MLGSRPRWALPGLALTLLTLLQAGCHLLPVRRVDPALDPRRLSHPDRTFEAREAPHLVPTEQVADRSVPLPPLPLEPISDREALGDYAPTPLLDEALVRARGYQDALLDDLIEPAPKSPLRSASPPLDVVLEPTPEPDPSSNPVPEASASTPTTVLPTEPATATSGSEEAPANPPVTEEPAAESEAHAEPAEQGGSWREDLERLRRIAAARAMSGDEDAEMWQLRAAWLDLLALQLGGSEPDLTSDDSLWSAVLSMMAASAPVEEANTERSSPTPTLELPGAGMERPSLRIADLALCRRVLGFGRYETIDTDACRPGQTVIVYCEMSGLRYNPISESEDEGFVSKLDATLEVWPVDAEPESEPLWRQELGRAEDRCHKPRRDYYVNYRVVLPSNLPPGPYRLRLLQRDVLASTETEGDLPVSLVAGGKRPVAQALRPIQAKSP